ncbi:DUF5362 family protein [Prosthecobacter sp.]|uniref:DUF5362 family protein n=1 Tax=Prosthecobacter sp. TaxID=1965333 RepID=UPI001E18D0F5|nr:DUF5362 family protein [Prosthecobacter sp.]MCB1278607.1 hypothetical protein [Prosthecobacter sp.]
MESTPPNPYTSPAANLYGASSGPAADGVSPSTIAMLSATKPWVRFMSVLMWIGVAFMLLGAIGMGAVTALGVTKQTTTSPFGGAELVVMAAIYGLMAIVYIFPAIKLGKYASRIGSLVSTRSVADLDAALNEQRSFWKFIGIMTIIMISLYLVVVVGFVVFGATAAMKSGAFK